MANRVTSAQRELVNLRNSPLLGNQDSELDQMYANKILMFLRSFDNFRNCETPINLIQFNVKRPPSKLASIFPYLKFNFCTCTLKRLFQGLLLFLTEV